MRKSIYFYLFFRNSQPYRSVEHWQHFGCVSQALQQLGLPAANRKPLVDLELACCITPANASEITKWSLCSKKRLLRFVSKAV